MAVRASPYRLRLRYERGTAREYAIFSGPLLFQGACVAVISLRPDPGGPADARHGRRRRHRDRQQHLGLREQGRRGRDRHALPGDLRGQGPRATCLQEAFLKSNRMGLLWATPTGHRPRSCSRPTSCTSCWARGGSDGHPRDPGVRPDRRANQIGFNWTRLLPRPRRHPPDRRGRRCHGRGGHGAGGAAARRPTGSTASRWACSWPTRRWWPCGWSTCGRLFPLRADPARTWPAGMLPAVRRLRRSRGAVRLALVGRRADGAARDARGGACSASLVVAITLLLERGLLTRVPRLPAPAARRLQQAASAGRGAAMDLRRKRPATPVRPQRRGRAATRAEPTLTTSPEDRAIVERASPYTMTCRRGCRR